MSKTTVDQVIQRAVSDAAFRRQLQRDPANALAGFDLSKDERAAITSGDPARLTSLGVDKRMSKAFVIGGMGEANKMVIGDAGASPNAILVDESGLSGHGALIDAESAGPNSVLVSGDAARSSVIVGDPTAETIRAFDGTDVGDGTAAAVDSGEAAPTVTAFEPGAGWSSSEAVLPPEDAAATETLDVDTGGDIQPTEY